MEDDRKDGGLQFGRIEVMVAKEMWHLTIIIKKNDQLKGKRLYNAILDYMMKAGIWGATVSSAVDGFGRRGRPTCTSKAFL
jgi:PII-like signaling protein